MDTDIYQLPNDHMDLDLAIFGDELPEGEAFPTAGHDQGSNQFEVVHTSSTASAPMRKKRRVARVLPVDLRMELRNKDLVDWKANYLQNMDAVLESKKQARKAQQAKKDAEYFVWGSGIGGFAHHYANITGPNPFEMFIGDNLFELATGFSRKKVVGSKHDRDSGIDDATQNESRRVRQKIGELEEELARRVEDEGFSMPMEEVEVELPREAVSALDDQQVSSAMPWNISASKHGSSAIPRSGRFNMMDQGRPGNRPGSRLVSASPLLGHGLPLDLEALRYLESEGDVGMGGDEFALPGPSSPPTVIGPPQKTSTRVSAALSVECENFLEFVIEAIVEKRNNSQPGFHLMAAEAAAGLDEITFQELLPPANNSRIVACQGLMMVLTLGTKDMLDVQQAEDFGDISLKLTEKAKTSQVIEISDSEEDESEDESEGDVQIVEQGRKDEDTFTGSAGFMQEDLEVEAGHFEEQFAAGHAAHEDNSDTLYNN
jgi:meiotic recombination protein REC8